MNKGRITLRGPIFPHTGYGQHLQELCKGLELFGHDVNILPTGEDEGHGAKTGWQTQKNIVRKQQPEEWEILIHPPDTMPNRNRKTVLWTMWEATKLPERVRMCVEAANVLIVPDAWNATVFSSNGYDGPIHIVPLGISANFAKYRSMQLGGPTVFGTAGRMAHGGSRKGLRETIEAFREAFPGDEDVRLKIKAHDDCPVDNGEDGRIEINRKWMSEYELAAWMQSLTAFVSCSKAEGWGLFQHQAMGCGRPVIAAPWAGLGNLLTHENGYPVSYELIPAGATKLDSDNFGPGCYLYGGQESFYRDCGHWAEPNEDAVVGAMRRVHAGRREAENKGVLAHRTASRYTWHSSIQQFYHVLKHHQIV